MKFYELFVLAVGLSMDAFAVSICKGLAAKKAGLKEMLICGLWFGGFQALMPTLGYFLGSTCEQYIEKIDHWLAFGLLVLIGANMIRESFAKNRDAHISDSFALKTMLPLAMATSIDSLAVGITFGLLPDVNIIEAVLVIGVVTFLFSAAGVKVGSVFGSKYQQKADLAGGIILILIGTKILFEHLGIINF
jgi:putative Mn2+ efflux pump MntP